MKKKDVKVGGLYTAKVGDRLVKVRIDSAHSGGGWNATNTATGKRIRIKSAQRLLGPAKIAAKAGAAETAAKGKQAGAAESGKGKKASVAKGDGAKARTAKGTTARAGKAKKTKADGKPKRLSALDAAAQVLAKADKPMRAKELITAMAEQGLWSSPAGKTPHATLYAAMLREERGKGSNSRFRKVDRGQFAISA